MLTSTVFSSTFKNNADENETSGYFAFETSVRALNHTKKHIGCAFIPDRHIQVKSIPAVTIIRIVSKVPAVPVIHITTEIQPVAVSLPRVPNESIEDMSYNLSTITNEVLVTEKNRICGLPAFCSQSAYDSCFNETLANCSECNVAASIAFIFFAVVLGLLIFVGNSLILAVGYKKHRNGSESKLDICKNSLALADILTGMPVFTVFIAAEE